MLGKLLKYEFKATGRTFLPLYGSVLVLAIINKIFYSIAWHGSSYSFPLELTTMLASMLYGFVICAIFVMTLIVTIQRFHKNLLGDEGYLMFTLPVKPWQHITSKMIVASVWFIVSVFITGLSGLLIGLSWDMVTQLPGDLIDIMRMFSEEFGGHWVLYGLELAVLGLLFLASGILMLYAAMSVGHLLNRHRMLGAFGAFLGLSFISQLITGLVIDGVGRLTNGRALMSFLNSHQFASIHIVMLLTMAWCALFAAAYFCGSNWVLKRRLNLE